jgi:hypothetical protein
MKENLKPIFDQIKVTLGNSEQLRETLEKNLNQARLNIETKAKEVVRQTRESSLVTDYVRPAIESDKAEEALNRIEARVTQVAPLVAKLREYRKQFLEATKPNEKPTKKKKSTKQPEA